MCHNFGSLSCRSLTGEGVTQVIVSQEYYKCRHRTNCFSSIHPVEFYLIWVFHVVMLWSLIFFSSLFLGNCWFWSHDRWQNSQATIKCDTHHSPISPNTKHGMGCPSSNLFDMWIFGSRYVDTWFLDMLMHFFIKTGLKKYTFLCSFLKAWCWWLTYITWWHDDMTTLYYAILLYYTTYILSQRCLNVVSTVMFRPLIWDLVSLPTWQET